MKLMPVALAATLSIAAPAQAATIVDTGTPTGGGYTIALNPKQKLAGRFSLMSATVLTDIQGYIGSSTNTEILTIAISQGTDTPGDVLYSGTVTSATAPSFQGLRSLDWMLDAGDYWVSFASSGYSFMVSGAPQPLAQGAYWTVDAWHPKGIWVPQNGSASPIGVRISGVAAAVPEPATWAMMLLGFGMVGAASRHRRRSTATISA
ncbi:PEPxxWA-CTERM sorting domain-containing protein [uncultured Sphingomonas sp.]|uniref:PEPxxWA-CTERM sorting domain-containing protein n=1 Tax=uncultured Sphingomonas sp. TaxID=158754 RepID=UPI0037485966